ncbi:hypothetical protein [Candidatus Nitrosotenuis sp. DW1]|uniref:hypothetical protein n=1 Tax=Candidatus Nitrosotenuis sp. DW1 TaxID=2259672 RepID=UPI0015CA96DF|nr:hypothetical protein [Candidatus Nitrosotenuis sp. DW1]QLH08811.1 hypothetical protein DSQ19_04325 [Candidatus Nitrosotenuis sp. DW1]
MDKQFELSPKHINSLFRLLKTNTKDVFYDFGCGRGLAVCQAVTKYHMNLSIGIELNLDYYEFARKYAIDRLTKNQLRKIEFHLGRFDNDDTYEGNFIYDYSDATIVYSSLDEEIEDLDFYKKRLNWKKVKIVKKDIPLIGFDFEANREHQDCWLFMMKYPFKRIKDKDRWASLVLGKDNVSITNLYEHYFTLLENRHLKLGWSKSEAKKDANSSVRNLKKIVCQRFC